MFLIYQQSLKIVANYIQAPERKGNGNFNKRNFGKEVQGLGLPVAAL